MTEKSPQIHANRRFLLLALVIVLALYVIVPQFGDFKSSWHLMGHPQTGWLVLGVIFTALTYLSAGATYCFLSFEALGYGRTVLMQFAAMFANRLLPAGIGALSSNFIYLKRNGHSSAQAGTVVAVNNVLGLTGHFIIFLIVFGINGGLGNLSLGRITIGKILIYLSVIAVLLLIAYVAVGKRRLKAAYRDVKSQLLSYRHRPASLGLALLSSMSLTLFNVLSFYFCSRALGVDLSLLAILLVFTLGVSIGTVTPTPGGLGGYEAALVAGLVAYNVPSSTALAVALLYRLISYWLALLAGLMAFILAQRRGYI